MSEIVHALAEELEQSRARVRTLEATVRDLKRVCDSPITPMESRVAWVNLLIGGMAFMAAHRLTQAISEQYAIDFANRMLEKYEAKFGGVR